MAALAAMLAAQDGGRVLRDALDKTAKVPVEFKGSIKRSGSDDEARGPMRMILGGSFEGEFAARLFEREAWFEASNRDKGVLVEGFRRGERTVKRVCWTGGPAMAEGFADQMLKILNFDSLENAARDGEFKEVEEETRDGRVILVVRGTLGEKLLREEERRDGPMMGPGPARIKKIEIEAKIDKENETLVAASISVTRELEMRGMKFQMEDGPPMEEGPDEEPRKIETRMRIEWKVEGTGDDLKPRPPEGMSRLLE
jgi:hypothetical protein